MTPPVPDGFVEIVVRDATWVHRVLLHKRTLRSGPNSTDTSVLREIARDFLAGRGAFTRPRP